MANNSVFSIGGKGVNQAVAAARDGGNVSFVGCVGDDIFSNNALRYLHSHHIITDHVRRVKDTPTGTASIFVTTKGENIIAVSPGANWMLTVDDVYAAEDIINRADVVIVQMEIPPETVKAVLMLSRKKNVLSILNPAPASSHAKSLYSLADIVTPNETEASQLTGIDVVGITGTEEAASVMLSEGVSKVVITLGKQGSYIASGTITKFTPSFPIDAIDPTGAGDVFNGVLAVAIASGMSLQNAVIRASAAAALSVTNPMAQDAAPDRHKIDVFLKSSSEP